MDVYCEEQWLLYDGLDADLPIKLDGCVTFAGEAYAAVQDGCCLPNPLFRYVNPCCGTIPVS